MFDGIVDGHTLERKLSIIESKAFEYAINGDEMLGCEAVNALLNVILSFDREKDGIYYTVGGMILLTSAEVYDWCYDLLTPELREAIVGGCENLVAPYMEIGFPPDNMGYISGHGSGSPILRDWLAFAIATYDDILTSMSLSPEEYSSSTSSRETSTTSREAYIRETTTVSQRDS